MIRKKVVVLGGGTGTSTLLSGLKRMPIDITAVISVSDNGSSTGKLRGEHELHITRAACLHTCHRDLLGDICRGHDLFRVGNVIVGYENNAELIVDVRVVVDLVGDRVYKFNDALSVVVSGSCLRTKDEGCGFEVLFLALFYAEIII